MDMDNAGSKCGSYTVRIVVTKIYTNIYAMEMIVI